MPDPTQSQELQLIGTFIQYAEIGDNKEVRKYLGMGISPRASGSDALRVAAQNGHLSTVKLLIEAGAQPSDQGHIALYGAANNNQAEIVEYLVKKENYEVNHPGIALVAYCSIGNIAKVKELVIGQKISPNAEGCNPLIKACKNNHLEIVKFLLASGARSKIGELDDKALETARKARHKEITFLLLKEGDYANENPELTAQTLCYFDEPKKIEELFKANPNINPDKEGLLSIAAKNGNLKTIETLIKLGATPHIPRNPAIQHAALAGQLEAVKLLQSHGGDVHFDDDCVLLNLCKQTKTHVEIIKFILKDKKVNLSQFDHNTLNWSLRSGNTEVSKILLEEYSEKEINDLTEHENTALMYVAKKERLKRNQKAANRVKGKEIEIEI